MTAVISVVTPLHSGASGVGSGRNTPGRFQSMSPGFSQEWIEESGEGDSRKERAQRDILRVSRPHEDGGPTIQEPAAKAGCTLGSVLTADYIQELRAVSNDNPRLSYSAAIEAPAQPFR